MYTLQPQNGATQIDAYNSTTEHDAHASQSRVNASISKAAPSPPPRRSIVRSDELRQDGRSKFRNKNLGGSLSPNVRRSNENIDSLEEGIRDPSGVVVSNSQDPNGELEINLNRELRPSKRVVARNSETSRHSELDLFPTAQSRTESIDYLALAKIHLREGLNELLQVKYRLDQGVNQIQKGEDQENQRIEEADKKKSHLEVEILRLNKSLDKNQKKSDLGKFLDKHSKLGMAFSIVGIMGGAILTFVGAVATAVSIPALLGGTLLTGPGGLVIGLSTATVGLGAILGGGALCGLSISKFRYYQYLNDPNQQNHNQQNHNQQNHNQQNHNQQRQEAAAVNET